MPEFTVEFQRTVVDTCSISVTAKDEDAATAKAEQMIEQADHDEKGELMKSSVEWSNDSVQYEINSVDED